MHSSREAKRSQVASSRGWVRANFWSPSFTWARKALSSCEERLKATSAKLLWQQPRAGQLEERGEELALGQVPGGSEEHDDARVRPVRADDGFALAGGG